MRNANEAKNEFNKQIDKKTDELTNKAFILIDAAGEKLKSTAKNIQRRYNDVDDDTKSKVMSGIAGVAAAVGTFIGWRILSRRHYRNQL